MNNPFGKTKTGKWLERNAGENMTEISAIISALNEETNFLRVIYEASKGSDVLKPYTRHVRRNIHESYLYWRDTIRSNPNLFFREVNGKIVPNKVGDVMIAYTRQRYRNFFQSY